MSKNIAIILAGGRGDRFGQDVPKQFQLLNGKKIIDYSIKTFENHNLINKIIIVCHKDWVHIIQDEYKDCCVITGGLTRQESSYKGLLACTENPENVLIHDAARPFITNDMISNSIDLLNKYEAINTCIKATDTVIVRKNNFIESVLNRESIFLSQTPQAFKYRTILKAHKKFKGEDASDDIQLVNKMNINCYNTIGSKYNIKITDKLDLTIAEIIINNKILEEV